MKKIRIPFAITALTLACLSTHSLFANSINTITHKQKVPSIHMRLKSTDCYTAPSECLLVVTPSKYNQSNRTYDIEKVCDYEDGQLLYNHALTLKDQVAERKFLGKQFCNGIVTISDMDLPFTKFDPERKTITDANDGLILINTAKNSIHDILTVLYQAYSLATDAKNGTYSSTQLNNMNISFLSLLSEVNRIANTTQFNGVTLLNGPIEFIEMQIPIHKKTYINSIPVNLMNATTGSSGLNIEMLQILNIDDANAALQPIQNAINKLNNELSEIERIRLLVESAAKHDATITTIDLTGPQFIVHQESELSA